MIQNPVLTGFHPDPSMICVDGTFYIANSTFEYFPGVRICASRDLANWEPVAYPLDTLTLLHMAGNPKSGGVWAPCLSYCDGLFYLVYTDVKSFAKAPFRDTHNYITTAPDITGPWSDPIYINSSGFDPSLFHDADGRKYFVNMETDYRVRGDGNLSGILLTELDPLTLHPISAPKKIFPGTPVGLVEGPHLYQKDGWYYLFVAEGGTEYGHVESVARAKDIWGPYEIHPQRHLLTTRFAPGRLLQKCGHASICQGPDGRWFTAFLCGRPVDGKVGGRCILGRETAINEIIWQDDWPYLKNGTYVPDLCFRGYGEKKTQIAQIDYDFTGREFAADFQSLRVPCHHQILPDGALRIYGGESPASTFAQNLLVRRQQDFCFAATTCVRSFTPNCFDQMAGLIYRYDETAQYLLRISYDEAAHSRTLGILRIDHDDFDLPLGDKEIVLADGPVYLRVTVNRGSGYFSYSYDSVHYTDIDYEIDATILSDDYAALGFTGAYVGMACYDMRYTQASFADFSSFTYQVL